MLSTYFTNKKTSLSESGNITEGSNKKHEAEHNKMENLMNSRHYSSKYMLSDKKNKKTLSPVEESATETSKKDNKEKSLKKTIEEQVQKTIEKQIENKIEKQVNKTVKEVTKSLKGGDAGAHKSVFRPLNKIKHDATIRTPFMPLEKEKEDLAKPIVESCQKSLHKPLKGVVIDYNDKDQEFSFFTPSFSLIGSFTSDQLVKYLVDPIDTDNRFLSDVKYQKAKEIIKRFVGSPGPSKGKLTLLDANSSPFMGNVEMLIRLNNNLHEFEQRVLPKIIPIIDRPYASEIKNVINKFIYYMLNHTMKMISIGSSKGGEKMSQGMKNNLSNYSIGTVYRISQYVDQQLSTNVEIQEKLIQQLKNIETVKNKLNYKMDNITKLLEEQNNYLQTIAEAKNNSTQASAHNDSTKGYTQTLTGGGNDIDITTNLTDSSDAYSLTGTMSLTED